MNNGGMRQATSAQARHSLPLRGKGGPRSGTGEGHAAPEGSQGRNRFATSPHPATAFSPQARRRRRRRLVPSANVRPLLLGLLVLALLWLGPLPERARGSFSAHMVMHMGVVAVAAPLLALGLARLAPQAVARLPVGLALFATLVELVAVWGWHAPALHDAARVRPLVTLAEQASFLLAGLFVWWTALGSARADALAHRLTGVGALLLTSMHMTLLGALLLFAPRPLYACAAICSPLAASTPLEDQAAGGAIMLAVGGIVYLAGGLALLAAVLRERRPGRETA